MFGTVRKHQTVLWSIIITIIIISFVVFFSPNASLDMAHRGGDFGSIKGKPITREEFLAAYKEMRLFYRLRFGEWPQSDEMVRMRGFDIEQETYNRILLSRKMDEMNIKVPADATARWIADLFKRSANNQGGSVAEQYEQFVKTQLNPNGITAEDFERMARHEVGNQHLVSVFGASGSLVSRAEAEQNFKRENENNVAEIVFFTSTNFLSQVKVDDAALKGHFDANMPVFRIPTKFQADYVRFAASDFRKTAEQQFNTDTNASLMLERIYFERGGTNFYKDDAGKGLTLEEARPKLKEDYLTSFGVMEARKAASEFIMQVEEFKNANAGVTNALQKVAATKGVKVEQTPLFDQTTELKNLPFSFKSAVAKLTQPGQVSSTPVLTEDAAVVVSLRQKVEGRIPELAEVRDRVVEDFKRAKASELARKAAEQFVETANKGLGEKKSFDSLVSGAKAKSVTLSPFNMSTQTLPELAGRVPLDRVQNATARLSPGQVSDLIVTDNGAAVVYLRERRPVDQKKLDSELDEYLARMRDQREYAAYVAWRSKLPEEMELSRPAAQQEQPAKGPNQAQR